ncbi:tellurite resistance TerB family protein [Sulfitobacter mediterraneus]|uniref:tellurite resistance TerB family protein n=1 Tax=Sulfitobacter mediterraneus TaxID=83219 RepID=UPI001934918B|nr:tellurite resistance TerB family protein [Sulfitobacter mediterraneus]MBM1632260.1 tellurite resistance TerB family protein [Sulfitobacter mediterraneus]MBM1640076.1 tellurite resistance TerB family protein [Sulfitobacter mediterraneus]MBM1644125.1 tellurite resistance TerB family protein [Sulfitobacter mediterraneus]MBM1648171.1 tellurite resistance TerB family protein [Sulfitobacter mediterraneus]MBM1652216.1 tellurite resistance TerB family protein [Sulfitobacter mediterraneus]
MSLMKTLAKVAVGVALAKGASSMMKKSGSGQGAGSGLGGLLGGLAGGGGGAAGGGLNDMLGGLLGGAGGTSRAGSAGGLGGLLEQLGGSSGGGSGLGGLLGGLAGAGGAGGLLAGVSKAMEQRPARNTSSFGAVLNSQFDATSEPEIEPSQEQEATAALMLAAMIQAAKSDGTFDEAEKEKLLGQLGDVDAEEAAFVQQQLQAPVDIDGLVAQAPQGMGPQVYAMSVLGIDLDTQDEAQYLHQLAQGLGLQPAQVNEIHAQMGVPSLYT